MHRRVCRRKTIIIVNGSRFHDESYTELMQAQDIEKLCRSVNYMAEEKPLDNWGEEDHPINKAMFAARTAYERTFAVSELSQEDKAIICKLACSIYIQDTKIMAQEAKSKPEEEPATYKQKQYMKRLKIKFEDDVSKKEAMELIDHKIGK